MLLSSMSRTTLSHDGGLHGMMCILDNGHWFGVGWSWLAFTGLFSLFCLCLVDDCVWVLDCRV